MEIYIMAILIHGLRYCLHHGIYENGTKFSQDHTSRIYSWKEDHIFKILLFLPLAKPDTVNISANS